MEYYQSEKITEHVIRIIDCTGVCCYLVTGSKRACLLDTCCGYGNIREYVQTLTNQPVIVVLSHGHYDHIGGASLFREVYMNPEDIAVYKRHMDPSWRDHDKRFNENVKNIPEKEIMPYLNPEEILPVKNGDILDLGGVRIRMLSVKGHTQGMMCPLLEEDRIIFFGDACGVGVLLFDEFSSSVSEYRQSLLELKKWEDAYDFVYRNHGTFVSEKSLLENVLECCDLILNRTDDRYPVVQHGYHLYAAKKVGEHGRIDGLEGNIFYLKEKV
ncbi:MBL fold metallo-hydrolase [Anaerocolumna jejuensis]|uniref:MBL fold metallo-hydrolase n=1 Tax=Anaerocolumna jejuensis TaxID=259063 RepID=UPI003F7C911D